MGNMPVTMYMVAGDFLITENILATSPSPTVAAKEENTELQSKNVVRIM